MTYRLFTLPNLITCCNLVCGCIATGAAFHGQYQWALLFIILGAVFDFFDGLTARALSISGPIGKELDSLADVVTFGLAPSTVIFYLFHEVHYPAQLMPLHSILPYTAFIMTAFSALRLAKFNLDERQHSSFLGLPTPAAAMICGSLACYAYKVPESLLASWCSGPFLLPVLALALSLLLVSEVPMFSMKFGAGKASRVENIKRIIFLFP